MITAVDTNVLIDVLEGDPEFGTNSAAALARACETGTLIACDVVWAEVATAYQPLDAVVEDLAAFGLRFVAMSEEAALPRLGRYPHANRRRFSNRRARGASSGQTVDARHRLLPAAFFGPRGAGPERTLRGIASNVHW